jgi:hypothetical protein
LIRFDIMSGIHGALPGVALDWRPSWLSGLTGWAADGLKRLLQASLLQRCLMKSKKAHPDIYNVLLQVMDRGTLTDNNGASLIFVMSWDCDDN